MIPKNIVAVNKVKCGMVWTEFIDRKTKEKIEDMNYLIKIISLDQIQEFEKSFTKKDKK